MSESRIVNLLKEVRSELEIFEDKQILEKQQINSVRKKN